MRNDVEQCRGEHLKLQQTPFSIRQNEHFSDSHIKWIGFEQKYFKSTKRISIYDGTYTRFRMCTCELSAFTIFFSSSLVKARNTTSNSHSYIHTIFICFWTSFPFFGIFPSVTLALFSAVVLAKTSQPLREEKKSPSQEKNDREKHTSRGISLLKSVNESIKTKINCSTCWFYDLWVGLPLAFQMFAILKYNWKINENAWMYDTHTHILFVIRSILSNDDR